MLQWLKIHFIPHHANDHRPRILQTHNIHRILAVVVFFELFVFLLPTMSFVSNAYNESMFPAVLSTLTNQERATQHLPTLSISATLDAAAQAKADDMAAKGYFAHTSPEGKTPWYWLDKAGYSYQYAGENLAVNFTDSKDVTAAWMNSPTHRANIVKANYTEVGTGIATGTFEGHETVFVAQVYGSPKGAVAIAHETAAPKAIEQSNKVAVVSSQETVATAVLGAETDVEPVVEQPTEVTPTPTPVPAITHAPSEVVSVTDVSPTLWQKFSASPRNTTNVFLFGILAIVIVAVGLNIGIKINHHHPDLITNGFVAIAFVGVIAVANSYVSKSSTVLIESSDYSAEHVQLGR